MERESNTLCTTVCPWTWSVWPRYAAVGRHYAQCKTPLHIFERGEVLLEDYWREIMLDHVCLFSSAISPEILFMDDNARQIRNAETSNPPEREDINHMQWLTYSLDLNPIWYVYNALCRLVITRPSRTLQKVKIALRVRSGTIFPHGLPSSLVNRMNNRCKMCSSVEEIIHLTQVLISVSFWQGYPFFVAAWKCSKRHFLYF